MSSRGKKKATMAKLNREARLRDRRNEKHAKKEARRRAVTGPPSWAIPPTEVPDADPQTGGDTR